LTTLLDIERDARATVITLSQAENANRLNDEMVTALHAALDDADPKRTLAFRGDGPGFSAGRPHSAGGHPRGPEAAGTALADLVRLNVRVAAWPAPTVAFVHGFINGAALGLTQHMDIVVVERGTRLSFPEITYNLPPALVVSYLGRKLNDKAVRLLVMTGAEVSAERALEMGLVSSVVDSGTLDAARAHLLAELGSRLEAEIEIKASIEEFLHDRTDLEAVMQRGVNVVSRWTCRPKIAE